MISWYWLISAIIYGIFIGVLLSDYIEEFITSGFAFVI